MKKLFSLILLLFVFTNNALANTQCIKPSGMPEYVKVGSIFTIFDEPYIFAQVESHWSDKKNKVSGKFTFISLKGGQLWDDAKELDSICSSTYGHAVLASEICMDIDSDMLVMLKGTNPFKYSREGLYSK